MSVSRPKTKKLQNATPNINLPIISSKSNKFNYKTIYDNNVYILKKLPEVTLKESSMNDLDKLEFNQNWTNRIEDYTDSNENYNTNLLYQSNKLKASKKELLNKQNLYSSLFYDRNLGHQIKCKLADECMCPTTREKLQTQIKCFLCHNEFNSKQIIKHENDCLDQCEQLLSEEKRTAIETQKEWLNLSDDQPNYWKKFRTILKLCSKCGRNFFEYRLEKHELICKGRIKQIFGKLNENDKDVVKEKLEKSIVFVRKTKPLNRSTQFYKMSTVLPNQSIERATKNQSISNLSSKDKRIEENKELSKLSCINSNLISQSSSSSSTSKISSTFAKCSKCGRVLNKLNMQTHIQFHARSLNQLAENCSRKIDKKLDRHDSIKRSVDEQFPTSNLDMEKMNQNDELTKVYLIHQLRQKFNPLNQSNQLCLVDQPKSSTLNDSLIERTLSEKNEKININLPVCKNRSYLTHDFVNDKFLFNENEWNEHLKQLKRCPKCNRTFFANRIKKHLSICKAKPI